MPEDTISGTIARCTMCSLLTFSKVYASNYVMSTRKRHFFNKERKNHRESISRQNCIFGGFYPGKKPLYSFVPKSFSTSCTYPFGARRMKDHHTINEKMRRDATKSHPYASRHLGNRIEVIQSKAIQMQLYT